MNEPKFPNVEVQLTGEDGNVFSIIGRVSRAMKQAGISSAEVDAYRNAMWDCESYDAALRLTMATVKVN